MKTKVVRSIKGDPRPQEAYPVDKVPQEPLTQCDLAPYKRIVIDGKVFPGFQRFQLNYDIQDMLTSVSITFVVARHGVTIKDSEVNVQTVRRGL